MRIFASALCLAALVGCDAAESDNATVQKSGERMEADMPAGAVEAPGSPPQVADADADAVPADYPATSACAETEATIFSCRISDGRTIAVCVEGDEQGREYAQYRFGRADGPPEIALPTHFAAGQAEWASVPYSGGGEAQLSFTRGAYRYVIYSRVIRTNFTPGEPNEPRFEDGAYVYRDGKRISSLPCVGEADRPVSVPMAERFAKQSENLFTD